MGIDFNEMFALVAKWKSVCSVVALATSKDWPILHLDEKTVFLNEDLKGYYLYGGV